MKNSIFKSYAKKILKSQAFVSVIIVFVLSLGIIGTSYSLYMDVDTDTDYQIVKSGDLSIDFTEGSSKITLTSTTPMDDTTAINQTNNVYQFTVYNNGTYAVDYSVSLIPNSSNTVKPEYINYRLCVGKTNESSNCGEVQTLSNKVDYVLYNDNLSNNGDSTIYYLKIWVNDNYPTTETSTKAINLNVGVEAKNVKGELTNTNTLGGRILNDSRITINKDVPDFSKVETTEKGIYLTNDNDGTSYYFRGKQSYNYVSFAGLTWRVVRINGDGSIRMILNNTVKQGAYNTFDDVFASISYVYGDNTSNDASVALTKDNPSNAKQLVDAWYDSYIKNYDDYVQESIFCNDINYVNDSQYDSYQGSINYEFYYSFGAEQRLEPTIPIPTLKCNENSSLKLKVGLVNADEVVFAGGSTKTNNSSYYLYSTIDYWTMSPKVYSKGSYTSFAGTNISLNVYRVTSGNLWMTASSSVNSFIKPVINLKKDILVSEGDGTSSNPYMLKLQ